MSFVFAVPVNQAMAAYENSSSLLQVFLDVLLVLLSLSAASCDAWTTNSAQRGVGSRVRVRRFAVPSHVALGRDARLECDYALQDTAQLYSLKWYKGSSQFFQYIPSRSDRASSVFSVHGLDCEAIEPGVEGRWVTLRNVTLAASDEYCCEVVAEGPPFYTTQLSANLTVAVVPDGGPRVTGEETHYYMHDSVTLNCTSSFSLPATNLTWFINDALADLSLTREVERRQTPAGFQSVTSQLRLTVLPRHMRLGELQVKCVSTLADLYHRSARVILREADSRWIVSSTLRGAAGLRMPHVPSPSLLILVALVGLLSLLRPL